MRIFIQVSRPPASSQLPQRGAQVVKETVKVWGLSAEESLVQLDEEYRRLVELVAPLDGRAINSISAVRDLIEPPQIVVEIRIDAAEQGTRGDRVEDLVEKAPADSGSTGCYVPLLVVVEHAQARPRLPMPLPPLDSLAHPRPSVAGPSKAPCLSRNNLTSYCLGESGGGR